MGIIILVPSLMVSASNTARIWFVRTYGESEMRDLFYQLARKSKLSQALLTSIVSALFVSLVGLLLVLLCPDPGKDWGYWFWNRLSCLCLGNRLLRVPVIHPHFPASQARTTHSAICRQARLVVRTWQHERA